MTRVILLLLTLALGLLAAALPAEGQKVGKVYHLGVLTPQWFVVNCAEAWADTMEGAFCQGLREFGYLYSGPFGEEVNLRIGKGDNLRMTYGFEYGELERLPHLAARLVRSKVDVILAVGTRAALAAKKATSTIPIVFVQVPDPAAVGLVANFARPGGNITGVTTMVAELGGKQLELLNEAVPGISRVAVLWNPTNPGIARVFKQIRVGAQASGVTLQSLEVRGPDDIERAFSAMTRKRADALLVIPDDTFLIFNNWILGLATQNQVPAMFWKRDFVEAGGLMSYGPTLPDLGRRTATLVAKILNGVNPADLPVERPTKFELTINLKTAKALGLTIPPSLLFRADRVIR